MLDVRPKPRPSAVRRTDRHGDVRQAGWELDVREPGGGGGVGAGGGAGAGNTVTVNVNERFTFFTPFINAFFGNNLQINASSTAAVLGLRSEWWRVWCERMPGPDVPNFTATVSKPACRPRRFRLLAEQRPMRDLRVRLGHG